MKLINLTPHAIVLQSADGTRTTVPPSGTVARVSSTPGRLWYEAGGGVPVPIYAGPDWGVVLGVPAPEDGTIYIVSLLVATHYQQRTDVVAPGTGPNDGAVRNAAGHIEAVTRLVRG